MLSSIISLSKGASRSQPPSSPYVFTPASDTTATMEAKTAELNQSLEKLHEVFPGADLGAIRMLLSKSSEESRLYVVTEMLLKQGGGSVSGDGARIARVRAGQQLERWQQFRSEEYKQAVKKAL
jgi:hypothetical protein